MSLAYKHEVEERLWLLTAQSHLATSYLSLRQDLLDSKRYVFERPLLIAGAGIAALSAFRASEAAAAVPFVVAGLLLFNFWFTVNRLYSAGRIVAYIQVQLEDQVGTWRGWETRLREYRKWIKRPDAKIVIDRELDRIAVSDALMYYPAIHRLHVGLALVALLSCIFTALRAPSPAALTWGRDGATDCVVCGPCYPISPY